MATFTEINLDKLEPPRILEQVSFEQIYSAMLDDFRQRSPIFDALVETDPAIILLQAAAYREMLLRQRFNDIVKGVMLAFSIGSDLDQIGANFNTERLEGESDSSFRKRIQLSFESFTTAGTRGSYRYWALTVPGVKDVYISQGEPGHVFVTVQSTGGDGVPSNELLDEVYGVLNEDDIRPLTDCVHVQPPTQIIYYDVLATLFLYDGPDAQVVRNFAESQLQKYTEQHKLLGHDITLSGIYSTTHVEGVQRVELNITENIVVAPTEIAILRELIIEVGGIDE